MASSAIRELLELIAAIDRRVPHVQRAGEAAIARDAAALRARALKRLAELEREQCEYLDASRFDEKVLRPTLCPFCKGAHVDPAVAKVITVKTSWRCRDCDGTWTMAASRVAFAARSH